MIPVISIGTQSFEKIRLSHSFYMDKTLLIREWWENQDDVTLIIRPRRFGKTLNLSMLECFFSNRYENRSDLFSGLSIWTIPGYAALQGTYPVICFSFADIKGPDYENARTGIVQKLVKLYSSYSFIRDSLNDLDAASFDLVRPEMPDAVAVTAIQNLTEYLYRYYGRKVLILLDEYDTPLQEAYINGYWDRLAGFIRSLFNATFKTNPYMERGLMTGITRITKESIFSDLNNLEVVTTTSHKYETAFGFTEDEVARALSQFGLSDQMAEVKNWYDGFVFGSCSGIYNPWSITKYLDTGKIGMYWANTSSNGLVSQLIREGNPEIKMTMEDLLAGKSLTAELDEQIVFDQLGKKRNAIWSLLLASGYLRVNSCTCRPDQGVYLYELSLTNREVRILFHDMVQDWFTESESACNAFIRALLLNDVDYMNQYMNEIARQTFSSFDVGNNPSEAHHPERFYHGFVLGLIAELAGRYQVTSNRESGFGRYDVMLEPADRTKDAYILEFKVRNSRKEPSLNDTLNAALRQIEQKDYDASLIAKGFSRDQIRHYGFAFEGKHVLIG